MAQKGEAGDGGMIMLPIIAEAGEAIADQEDRAAYYTACMEFLAFGREPEALPAALAPVWVFARDALEHSRKKAQAGRTGGESRRGAGAKQSESKREADAKQNESKREANAKQNESKREANAKPVSVSVTGTEDLTPRSARGREAAPLVPPTAEEVRAYAFACGYPDIDAERFLDHYASVGWMSGSTPIVDWKPKLRAWGQEDRRRRAACAQTKGPPPRAPDDLAQYR